MEEEKDDANLSDPEEPSGPSNMNKALQRSFKPKNMMTGLSSSQFNWGLLVDKKVKSKVRSHRSASNRTKLDVKKRSSRGQPKHQINLVQHNNYLPHENQ